MHGFRRAAWALLLLVSAAVPATPARAENAFAFLATGVLSPGIMQNRCDSQSVSFDTTTSEFAGTDNTGSYDFSFQGSSDACTQSESGSGTVFGDLTGSLSYVRVGADVTLTGTVYFSGWPSAFTAKCTWLPTSLNPVSSFALACVGSTSGSVGRGPAALAATGTIDPIPASGCAGQPRLSFAGTAAVAAIESAIWFSGQSHGCATLLADQGSGQLSGAYNGWVDYVRDAVGMRFTGDGLAMACLFVPTSANPTTTFALTCVSTPAT